MKNAQQILAMAAGVLAGLAACDGKLCMAVNRRPHSWIRRSALNLAHQVRPTDGRADPRMILLFIIDLFLLNSPQSHESCLFHPWVYYCIVRCCRSDKVAAANESSDSR